MASKKQRKNPFTRDRGTIVDGQVVSTPASEKDKDQWKYTGERNGELVCNASILVVDLLVSRTRTLTTRFSRLVL